MSHKLCLYLVIYLLPHCQKVYCIFLFFQFFLTITCFQNLSKFLEGLVNYMLESNQLNAAFHKFEIKENDT